MSARIWYGKRIETEERRGFPVAAQQTEHYLGSLKVGRTVLVDKVFDRPDWRTADRHQCDKEQHGSSSARPKLYFIRNILFATTWTRVGQVVVSGPGPLCEGRVLHTVSRFATTRREIPIGRLNLCSNRTNGVSKSLILAWTPGTELRLSKTEFMYQPGTPSAFT